MAQESAHTPVFFLVSSVDSRLSTDSSVWLDYFDDTNNCVNNLTGSSGQTGPVSYGSGTNHNDLFFYKQEAGSGAQSIGYGGSGLCGQNVREWAVNHMKAAGLATYDYVVVPSTFGLFRARKVGR